MVRCKKVETRLWMIAYISRRVDSILHTWLTSTLQYHSIPGSYTLSMLSSASQTCAYCNPWLSGSMPVIQTRPTVCSPPKQAKPSHFQLGGGLNDPQMPKTWEVFASRHFWVRFWPMYRGSRWILISRGFRICMAKGGRGSKVPGFGQLSISPPL